MSHRARRIGIVSVLAVAMLAMTQTCSAAATKRADDQSDTYEVVFRDPASAEQELADLQARLGIRPADTRSGSSGRRLLIVPARRLGELLRSPSVAAVAWRGRPLLSWTCTDSKERLPNSYWVWTDDPRSIGRKYGSGGFKKTTKAIALNVDDGRLADLIREPHVERVELRCAAYVSVCDPDVPVERGFKPIITVTLAGPAVGQEYKIASEYTSDTPRVERGSFEIPASRGAEAELKHDPRVTRIDWHCGEKLQLSCGGYPRVAERFLVTFKVDVTDALKSDMHRLFGAEFLKTLFPDGHTVSIKMPEMRVKEMAADPRVRYVQGDCKTRLYDAPRRGY